MNRQQLIEDNMGLVYFLVNKYYPTFIGDEDIIQCGMVGLCKAADTWDESKCEFSTYASRCVLNEIVMEFRRRRRHHGVLSLDYTTTNSEGEVMTFGDTVVGTEDVDFVDQDSFYDGLSEIEKQMVNYRRLGLTHEEISKKIGCSRQWVSMTMRKIKRMKGIGGVVNGD